MLGFPNGLLPDVDQQEKKNPDHVDEVPEQAHRSDAHLAFVVVPWDERTRQHQPHQQDPGDHVQTVKSREQIEQSSEHTCAEAEAELRPFEVLAVNEVGAHGHGEQPDRAEAPEVALVQISLSDIGHET